MITSIKNKSVPVPCDEITSEDVSLLEAVRLFDGQGRSGGVHWKRVAKHLGKRRTSKEYRTYWKQTLQTKLEMSIMKLTAALPSCHTPSIKRRASAMTSLSSKRSKIENDDDINNDCAELVESRNLTISTQLATKPLSAADYALVDALQLYGPEGTRKHIDWDKVHVYVREKVNETRNKEQLRSYWKSYLKKRLHGVVYGKWSTEEDQALIEGVKKFSGKGNHGGIAWEKITEEMPRRRSAFQCKSRWVILQPQLSGARAGKWAEAEDILLREAVALYGDAGRDGGVSWKRVSEHMAHKRSSIQCRLRWKHLNVA